ncbi:ATP-binding protein, partial [Streptomyces sp. NPDC057705]
MIVWLNGTHGAGKTTTSALVQPLIPDSRVFDAEKVGETLMDITPGLPGTDNFQHWPPWRPLVVETARRVLDYTGGTLVMPMT